MKSAPENNSSSSTRSRGNWGERRAEDFLVAQGYAIVERNWRMHHYEIDLIVQKDDFIIFVEVKLRQSADYDPVSAVDSRKRRRMVSSADVYLKHYDLPHQFRFDIISIVGTEEAFTIEHIPDAFFPTLKRY